MNQQRLQRITIDPQQCGGRPCIRGSRIRVTDILELLAASATHDEILGDYPFLEAQDIYAALEYAARQERPFGSHGLVKFLIDNQLPPALARLLEARGVEAEHAWILDWRSPPTQAFGPLPSSMTWS